MPRLNYIDGDVNLFKASLKADDLYNFKGLPRAEPVVDAPEERPKSPWSLAKSFFAQYQADTEELMTQCFDFDWNTSKIEKLAKQFSKDQRDRAYAYLNKNYRKM